MPQRSTGFTAVTVECSEALDWEIVQVNFDTMDPGLEEADRISPYLMISANFEFDDKIQMEFHDGEDYAGDNLNKIDLWRNRVRVLSERGHEFDIAIELSDDAFTELREYLKVVMGSDCFRE
jgi:hypothetical protein